VGCAEVCWEGATTQRPGGRQEKQRSQRALEWRNRARSALTQKVKVIEAKTFHHFKHLLRLARGQLRFLGSFGTELTAAAALAHIDIRYAGK
jgi:hypothetical protein